MRLQYSEVIVGTFKGLAYLALILGLAALLFALQPESVGQASENQAMSLRGIALPGEPVRYSSPVLANLDTDAALEIVVGGRDGILYAYNQDGSPLPGFPFNTGHRAAIESSPAVGDIDGDGRMEIVFGAGSTFTPNAHGGLYALNDNGSVLWRFNTPDSTGDGYRDAVYSSPALGDLDGDGTLEVVFGSWDSRVRALNGENGSIQWEVFLRDTVWSSPALGDIDRDGYLDVVIGVDTHYEAPFGTINGGALHVFNRDGAELTGFPRHVDEIIVSSPALVDLDGDRWLDIVVGTGHYYNRGRQVHAWDHNGNYLSGWPKSTGNSCWSSPAVGNLDGDQLPEVVIGCRDGKLYGFDAYRREFTTPVHDRSGNNSWGIDPSPILADIDGDGVAEILVAYNWDVAILEGNGTQTSQFLQTNYTVSNSPAVGDIDADGAMEIVVAGGYNNGANGMIYIWDTTVTSQANPWPMFHKNEMHDGRESVPPVMEATPSLMYFQHPVGDQGDRSAPLALGVSGDCPVTWRATASEPSLMLVSPHSGIIQSTLANRAVVDVDVIEPDSYAEGRYSLGSVIIEGQSECGPVPSVSVPVTLDVGAFSSVYLPFITQAAPMALYADSFDRPTSGWSIQETGKTGSGYFGHEYGVHISDNDLNYRRSVVRGPSYIGRQYTLQVEARSTTPQMGRCGVVFNANSDMSEYEVFWVDTLWSADWWRGSRIVRRHSNGSWSTVSQRGVSGTSVRLYDSFTLQIQVSGPTVKAYVNGVLIHSYTDGGAPTGGYIGLFTEHSDYGDPPIPVWWQYHRANCHFDNLVVTYY